MDKETFHFRRYMESDGDILYEAYTQYCRARIQPYFSGVGVGAERQRFLEEIQKLSRRKHCRPIIADSQNRPIGIYRTTFRRANGYHELMIHLWEGQELAVPILRRIVDEALHRERPEDSFLLEAAGCDPYLTEAAQTLGLKCCGMIPNYLCCDEGLCHRYFYVVTSGQWYSRQKPA